MTDVRLVDLDLIKRYSLAVRQESVPADELLAVLDATREQVVAAMTAAGAAPRRPRRSPRRAT
jgi:hypothetical protein